MSEKLNNLYNQIYQDESAKDPKKFIGIVEQDLNIIDKSDYENHDDYVKATRLLADYGISLFNTGYLKKAIPYLDRAIKQIENDQKIKDNDLFEEPLYEVLIFNRGMTLYNLKKYKESRPDFKILVNRFPDNDRYKNWYNASADYLLNRLQWGFLAAFIITTITSLRFGPETGLIDKLSFFGLIISFIGTVTISILRRYKKIK
jgi:tetratricopeptide (TPR) repeat protein